MKEPSAILLFNPCGLVPAEDKTLFCDSSLFYPKRSVCRNSSFIILHSSLQNLLVLFSSCGKRKQERIIRNSSFFHSSLFIAKPFGFV
ncbi:MAG: hypothetical protein IKC11_04690 [Clostridia bacterium]|nr:hypothetical protein [Clostridia bacterium]